MKLYTAEDLELEPIVLMTDNEHDAIASFHWSIVHGFGFWPNLNFALSERDPESLPRSYQLGRLLARRQPGYASLNEKGWARVPFRN